jgi:hypothetical protein
LGHAMNITKGLDRIALVIAVIAMLPSFIGGMYITYEWLTTESAEYKAWQKEYDERLSYLRKKEFPDRRTLTPEELFRIMDDKTLSDMREKRPSKLSYPPMWQKLAGGSIGAVVGLFLVLFTLRGMTRLTIWIIDGFRERTDYEK